ncbi:MAG: hypothetical protein HC781_22445 [Leptolyngbyaceae cyanobacterium CSU_1_4]|nr:hypothetical protein [Leptolyngbyaceae cyanobacterium CSU_1_4]
MASYWLRSAQRIITNYPFVDGNRRAGRAAAETFLALTCDRSKLTAQMKPQGANSLLS